MLFKLGQFYAKNRRDIKSFACFFFWLAGWFILPEWFYPYYLGLTAVFVAFFVGRTTGREEIRDRILGKKGTDGKWQCEDGTEIMGMKWVSSYWAYRADKQTRRVNWINDHWEFEDGTKPERVNTGSIEVVGHWESSDGTRMDPTGIAPLEFADLLHDWANKVGKFLPLGIEGAKIGFQLIEQDSIVQKYGAVLQQPGPMFRRESELPFPKAVIRRRLADALLNEDLDENMRNQLAVGLAQLEYFLPKEDFDIVDPLFQVLRDKNNIELAERGKRGEDISADAKTLAQKLSQIPDYRPVRDKVFKRERERCYQLRVLKSIASGESDPDMTQLMAQVDKEVEEAAGRLQERWGMQVK